MINRLQKNNRRDEGINVFYSANRSGSNSIVESNLDSTPKIINKYYNYLFTKEEYEDIYFSIDCIALKLSRYLIDLISDGDYRSTEDSFFPESFYTSCISDISKIISEKDHELIIIYLKQIVLILKSSNIIQINDTYIEIDSVISDKDLFFKLFGSFWNTVDWREIFPSDKKLAIALSDNKHLLIDLILREKNNFNINHLLNKFFEMSHYSGEDTIFYISYIDFYFFAWLKNFGLIQYIPNAHNDPVNISLTEIGEKVLFSL